MSIRLDPSRSMPLLPGTVFDTLVIFSGWEKNNLFSFAVPLPHMHGTTISAVDLWLDAEASSPAGSLLQSTGLYGILTSTPLDICPHSDTISPIPLSASTLTTAWAFIETHFDPRGRLIIYGNSAGGDCALNLCRAISQCKRWYWYQDPLQNGFMASPASSEVLGETCVDLLVTVDAAAGPASDFIARDVPECVAYNENYYQLTAKWEQQLSHGAPNTASNPSVTKISNEDFTGRADHYAMGWMTRAKALSAINTCRGI